MGRKKRPKAYLILFGDAVCSVSSERIYTPEAFAEDSLMDELQCQIADTVLIALRKAFSLTYPRNPFIDGLQAALAEIRRTSVEAMKRMPEVLADLGLPPIPAIINDPVMDASHIFKFVFAPIEAIDISVQVGDKTRRLLDVVPNQEATQLLTTLRSIISDTFEEAHDEDQHKAILLRIRQRIQDVLPAFNGCLASIEIEPISESSSKSPAEEEEGDAAQAKN